MSGSNTLKMTTQALAKRIERNPHERHTLLRQLMRRHDAQHYLLRFLHSDDIELRLATLARLEPDVARGMTNELIQALGDVDERVRGKAVVRLDELRAHEALDPLMALSRCDPSVQVRKAALRALGGLGDHKATRCVALTLKNHDEGVRMAAADSLLLLGDPSSAPALEQTLSDSDVGVRLRAIRALVSVKATSAATVIAGLTQDTDPMVREAAVRALGKLASENTAEVLVRVATDERNPELRLAAVHAMARFRDKATAICLVSLLREADVELRCAAADALATREQYSVLPQLRDAIRHESDASARHHIEACIAAIASRNSIHQRRIRNPLWATWYSSPNLDAGSLIYTFRSNGTGEVEDFAMGITRELAPFQYRRQRGHLSFMFSGQRNWKTVKYRILRTRYWDPVQGNLPCRALEFYPEPYFVRRRTGKSVYYHVTSQGYENV